MIRSITAVRYVVPLREGGSLPAVVEADDGGTYVMKFVGAGQGRKALIAELIAGEIGRTLGLNVPELVLLEMSPYLGRSEPDPEIQDLLQASVGINFGMRYLPGAFAYNQLIQPAVDPDIASAIVWFDAYVTNVDRTARNVNMLLWNERLWLIDHGAALYVHHDWHQYLERSRSPFAMISQHTLLPDASRLPTMDPVLRSRLDPDIIRQIVDQVPDSWLAGDNTFVDPQAQRDIYLEYMISRLAAADIFVEEAIRARHLLL